MGQFAPPADYQKDGAGFTTLAVADLNSDGYPELVTSDFAHATATTFQNLRHSPAVTLSTHTVGFGSEKIGDTSPPRQVTLTNSGYSELDISSITVSGNFLEKNTCGSKVAIQASCTITVAFRPRTAGFQTGTVTITDNANGQPQVIHLRGYGTP